MIISRQIGYFDGSLESVLSAILLDFPPQFSVVFEHETLRAESVDTLARLLSVEDHAFLSVGIPRPEPEDRVRRVGFVAGLAEYVYHANVVHVPTARHTLLDAKRRLVHYFQRWETEAAKRDEDGFFRISTPLASNPLSYYVRKVLKLAQTGERRIPEDVVCEALTWSVSLGCEASSSHLTKPCGVCASCVWAYLACVQHSSLNLEFEKDPRDSDLLGLLRATASSYDDLTRQEIECQR